MPFPRFTKQPLHGDAETDNGDPLGKVIFTGDANSLNPEQLEKLLAGFIGWHEQIPHATSARRIDGERAYLKAHRGEMVAMPASRVYLHEARWIAQRSAKNQSIADNCARRILRACHGS